MFLGVFIIVLVQDLGFAALLWGIIQFLPRVFDAITDPIMGFISDNTRSKWGRRRQYVFVGAILMGLAYVAMWQLHKSDGITYNFIYFLSWSLVFYLGLTIFSVPYVAMGYEISEDFHERTQIMAVAQFIGQWAWVIAPWFWVILYDPSWFPEGADAGVRELSVWVAIPCTVFAMIPALFLKSKSTLDRTDFAPINVSAVLGSVGKIFKSAFEAFRIKQFRQIAGATFLIFNSFNVIAAFTFLIIVHHMFNSDPASAGTWPAMHGSGGRLDHDVPRHPHRDVDVQEHGQEKGLHRVAVHFDRGVRAVLVSLHSGQALPVPVRLAVPLVWDWQPVHHHDEHDGGRLRLGRTPNGQTPRRRTGCRVLVDGQTWVWRGGFVERRHPVLCRI